MIQNLLRCFSWDDVSLTNQGVLHARGLTKLGLLFLEATQQFTCYCILGRGSKQLRKCHTSLATTRDKNHDNQEELVSICGSTEPFGAALSRGFSISHLPLPSPSSTSSRPWSHTSTLTACACTPGHAGSVGHWFGQHILRIVFVAILNLQHREGLFG